MADSKARIGFLTIPPELRNRIYELVLTQKDVILGPVEDGPMGIVTIGRSLWYPPFESQGQPALTKTCHTIRSESLAVYYGRNKFRCSAPGSAYAGLVEELQAGTGSATSTSTLGDAKFLGDAPKWLQAIGKENTSLIKAFEVRIEQHPFYIDLGPEATYPHLVPHASEISELLVHYIKQQGIVMPRCTKLLAREDVGHSAFNIDDPWQMRAPEKTLLVLERADGTRGEESGVAA